MAVLQPARSRAHKGGAVFRRPPALHRALLHQSLITVPCFLTITPQLTDLKTELAGLRVAKVTGGAPNKLSKM